MFIALTVLTFPAVAQQQQQLTNIQTSQNGDWTMKCGDLPNSGRLCEMTQVINNPRDGKPVMQAAVIKPPGEQGALLRFIAPLGIWLRPGLSLSIDGAEGQNMDTFVRRSSQFIETRFCGDNNSAKYSSSKTGL
jgi:invasion protein IalB